jgi:hypothetical protein
MLLETFNWVQLYEKVMVEEGDDEFNGPMQAS